MKIAFLLRRLTLTAEERRLLQYFNRMSARHRTDITRIAEVFSETITRHKPGRTL